MSGDLVDALLDRAQHAESEQVDLQEAGVGARVLVPLADLATLHGCGHERHELVEPTRGDDHPTRVLREVARQPGDLGGQERERAEASIVGPLGHAGQARHLGADGLRVVAVGGAGQTVEVGRGQSEHLAELANRPARAVGGERGDQCRSIATVALVHRGDQLRAHVAWKVEVDVRRGDHLAVEEASEREPGRHGVDVREARQVADDRADRGAAPASRR